MAHHPVVVIDNGGGSCKVGVAGNSQPTKVFPNCTGKPKGERQVYVGDMLADCKDIAALALRRPFDRGYLVNWDLEKEIWSRALKSVLRLNPKDCSLLMTEPIFNFPQIQSFTQEVVFEELGFQAMYAQPAPWFSIREQARLQPHLPACQALTGLVVDAGFSFTHLVPIVQGSILLDAVKRINLGGKALTNYLKEMVSYRSLNMMEETYLMEHVKEAICFVSQDIDSDFRVSKSIKTSPYMLQYVLPDGIHNVHGYVRQPGAQAPEKPEGGKEAAAAAAGEQVLVVNNERFLVAEALFQPVDLGLDQAGVPEALVQAVGATHPALHGLLYSNVLLTGGTSTCPGFAQRLERELRPLVPDSHQVGVHCPPDPTLLAWCGASSFGASGQYGRVALTKGQYEEQGPGRRGYRDS